MRAVNRLALVLSLGCLGLAAPAAADAAGITAHGSMDQVYATGLKPGAHAQLLNARGHVVARRSADAQGGVLFTGVKPGAGYRVRLGSSGDESASLTVHSEAAAPWDPGIYHQKISPSGYQYLTTRDGTKLAIYVHPPDHPAGISSLPDGISLPSSYSQKPYPTLIEYAGYGYADPAGPDSGIAVLANLMGFAVVDVNMRGTGCSGGAFNYFEALQNLDAYDVIETIAHQPWVLGHKVGMMGISYGAISQLFTAQLDPPALEAIAPLSTIDSTITTLYPGGILNTGFAVSWAAERQHDAEPAGPTTGQSWAYKRIQQGDQICKQQPVAARRGAEPDQEGSRQRALPALRRRPARSRDLRAQDQGGGVHGLPVGGRADRRSLPRPRPALHRHGPQVVHVHQRCSRRLARPRDVHALVRLPVAVRRASRAEQNAGLVEIAAPFFYSEGMDLSNGLVLPPDPIQQIPTYQAALAAYEQLPSVRVLFDNGSIPDVGSQHDPRRSRRAIPTPASSSPSRPSRSPAPSPRRGTSGPVARLPPVPPRRRRSTTSPGTRRRSPRPTTPHRTPPPAVLWGDAADWDWNWQQNPAGRAVSYVSAPLTANTTVIGGGAVHLWIKASTPNVDLQATVSEVDPGGTETFVQNGWLRADERKLAPGSTLLEPSPDLRKSAVEPLPSGQFVEVTIPLYYEGHVYRAGSRIRVTIAAPGDAEPLWAFAQTNPSGTANVSVQFSPSMPSNIVLPVVPGVSVPSNAAAVPACPSLRNEPCRTYVPYTNQVAGG